MSLDYAVNAPVSHSKRFDVQALTQSAENHACAILATQGQKTAEARAREWTICRMLCKSDSASWRNFPLSEDNRQRMRAAWVILEVINAHSKTEALHIRRNYSHRRVLEAGAAWKRYEFAVNELIDHIKSDLSIGAMKMQIEDVNSPYPEWMRKASSITKWAAVIASSYDAPAEVKAWAAEGEKLMKQYGEVK